LGASGSNATRDVCGALNALLADTFALYLRLQPGVFTSVRRLQDALSRLPDDVQRLGVQVRKARMSLELEFHKADPLTNATAYVVVNDSFDLSPNGLPA
jgi:hypothetical protein